MIKTIDEIIYYPSTQKVMIQELRTAIGLYQEHGMTNDEFYFLISHYVQNFSYLLFSDDYEIHRSVRAHLGARSTRMLEAVISEIRRTREEEMRQ
ncbi:MAG: hypothetical protein ACI4UJ_10240 [Candidatus Cryptobacteroides sp.]